MDTNVQNFEEKVSVGFYFLAISHVICMCISFVTALFPLPLPNFSMVFYSLGLICIWQLIPIIRHYCIQILSSGKKKRVVMSYVLGILSLFFICSSIVSGAATFCLFPNPYVHKILCLYLYITGTVVGLWGCHQAYFIFRGIHTQRSQDYIQKREIRKQALDTWISQIRSQREEVDPKDSQSVLSYLQNIQEADCFSVEFWSYLLVSTGYMVLWMCIPVWIFVAIPLKTFPSFDAIPLFYIICMAITVIFVFLWLISIILSAGYRYYINEKGLFCKGFFSYTTVLWNEVKYAYIENDLLCLKKISGKNFRIRMGRLETPRPFFQKLQDFLPLEIFLITEDGWCYLQRILNTDFKDFATEYKNAFSPTEKKESVDKSSKKKKSKSGKK